MRDDDPVPDMTDDELAEIAEQIDFALSEQGEFYIDTMPLARRVEFVRRKAVEEIVHPLLC